MLARYYKSFSKSNDKKLFFNIKFLTLIAITAITIDISRLFGSINSVVRLVGSNYFIISFLILYFITFNTPFISVMGNKLITNKDLDRSIKYEAIIVFSGDGDTSYNNQTYRQRTFDAINYAKKFNTKKILLSSGRGHQLSEVELLRLFLIDQNIEEEKIFIFEKFPPSTYHNIIMVGKKIKEMRYKNVIFITAPFHYKRSM